MVNPNRHSWILDFIGGPYGMEIAVLLLLTLPLTAATPLRPNHRSDTDAVLPVDTAQASGVEKVEDTQEQHVQEVKIIPFRSEDRKHLDLDAMKHRMALKLRPRRAPKRGCQFMTCQVHILADTLNNIGKTNGKDHSKNARDPQGYGR